MATATLERQEGKHIYKFWWIISFKDEWAKLQNLVNPTFEEMGEQYFKIYRIRPLKKWLSKNKELGQSDSWKLSGTQIKTLVNATFEDQKGKITNFG